MWVLVLLLAGCDADAVLADDTGRVDTDAVVAAAPVPDVVAVTGGGGEGGSERFRLRVSVGEPVVARELASERYEMTLGVGTVRPVEAP